MASVLTGDHRDDKPYFRALRIDGVRLAVSPAVTAACAGSFGPYALGRIRDRFVARRGQGAGVLFQAFDDRIASAVAGQARAQSGEILFAGLTDPWRL